MHDPYILIARVGRLLLWHRDKEGCDGACGWSSPNLTKRQLRVLKGMAWSEAHQPLFQVNYCKRLDAAAEAESLMRGLIVLICNALDVNVSMDQISRWALELVHHPADNFRSSLAFIPGYHSNREEDTPEAREYHAERLYYFVARAILKRKRKWWQHPRWHVWHWRVQLQKNGGRG